MGEESSSIPINWQALATIATFIAVVIALIPIWREANRTKAKARSLRFRLSSKLMVLRPTLLSKINEKNIPYPEAILPPERFRNIIQSIAAMMQESSVLNTDEQDQIGVMFANLEISGMIYGTDEFKKDTAKNILMLIDRSIAIMGENGFLTGEVIKPWDE